MKLIVTSALGERIARILAIETDIPSVVNPAKVQQDIKAVLANPSMATLSFEATRVIEQYGALTGECRDLLSEPEIVDFEKDPLIVDGLAGRVDPIFECKPEVMIRYLLLATILQRIYSIQAKEQTRFQVLYEVKAKQYGTLASKIAMERLIVPR